MSPDDIRAVENPISAMFDLADQVSNEAPQVRKLVRYASFFVGFWLVLNFIFLLATIGNLLIFVFLFVMFILGILALLSLRNLNDFFKYYTMRHSFIRSVRDADPVVIVPKGNTAVERLKAYLVAKNPAMLSALSKSPSPAMMKGNAGIFYQFDAYVASKPSVTWRLFGAGYPGYQLFVKWFEHAPRIEDINALKRAVEDVAQAEGKPASRVIMLWSRKEDEDITEEAYNQLLSTTLVSHHRGRQFACSMELIVENADGTYEFIPFISEAHAFTVQRGR
ncbi:MAG: hypothetical protein A4E32_00127 [Methanomassiliicoccales archaeon PtaU1.Bin124]|nr:MAG: hypothetical protein A4E32_00127 [Methanomassiliicoccales archaeon PtaU1.Bin124]